MALFAPFERAVDDMMRMKSSIREGMDAIRTVANDVLEVSKADPDELNIEILKEHMKEMIKLEYDLASFSEAADAVKQQAKSQDFHGNKLKQVLDTAYEAARGRQPDPEHHVAHKDLLNILSSVEEGSLEDSANDDSMLVSEESRQWKDPITQCDIENPVKNTRCNHVYDKNSISLYIKTTQHPRCPYMGCTNPRPLKLTELVDDLYVMRILKEKAAKK